MPMSRFMLRFKTWFKTWFKTRFKLLFRKHWCLLIICSLCVILAITLYDTSNQAVNWEPEPADSSSLHVGFSQIETDNPWRTAQINSFREALIPNGMDFIYHEPDDYSVQWQLEDIRSLIREGVDYLVIVPADLSALTPVLQDAKDAGIPVILIDQSAETIDQSYYVSLISADYLKEGQICAGLLADKFGRRSSMITITTLIILFALFVFPPLLGSGSPALVMAYLLIGLSLMGLTFGPMGALLPELFPTEVRYTGASFSYNVSSILGASVAPYIATWLQANYGLFYVGVYLAAMAALTLIALLLTHETKHQAL